MQEFTSAYKRRDVDQIKLNYKKVNNRYSIFDKSRFVYNLQSQNID